MKVQDCCSHEVITIESSAGLTAAAARMREAHVGALVVVKGRGARRRPVGMLTDRDLVVGAMALGVEATALRVEDIMSRQLLTAAQEEPLITALQRMEEHGVRRLPVVDGSGTVTGLLALDDVFGALADIVAAVPRLIRQEQSAEYRARTLA